MNTMPVIDEQLIEKTLAESRNPSKSRIDEVLAKAAGAKGLLPGEIATLIATEDPEQLEKIFTTAKAVKEHIYGRRLVLFAPLYISN